MQRIELAQRYQEVLAAVVSEYIATAEAVSSRLVAKRLGGRISSATARQIMSGLMDMGYLYQPHTSAGRYPTMLGLRYYVENLMEMKELDSQERENIIGYYKSIGDDELSLSDVLQKTSRFISSVSHYAGLVFTPNKGDIVVRHVEFIPMGSRRILGLFVTPQGEVYKRMMEVDDEYSYPQLEKISNYCNRSFIGLTISEVRRKIAAEIVSKEVILDKLILQGLVYSKSLFAGIPDEEIIVEGEGNLLSMPEFSSSEKLRELMEVLAEDRLLLSLLEKSEEEQDYRLFIGSVPSSPKNNLGMVAADYMSRGRRVGSVGIIGPARMDYPKMVPFVRFTATLISDIINLGAGTIGGAT